MKKILLLHQNKKWIDNTKIVNLKNKNTFGRDFIRLSIQTQAIRINTRSNYANIFTLFANFSTYLVVFFVASDVHHAIQN